LAYCIDYSAQLCGHELAEGVGNGAYTCHALMQLLQIVYNQWAFFELGMYTSKPVARADVIKDFIMGRLDVGK
jgi:hypothetical protein